MNLASHRVSSRLRLVLAGFSLALLAALPPAHGAESAPGESPKVDVPIVSTDEAVQADLLKLDRLLETNPKLEETLRTNLDQLTQDKFRAQNPEVDALLKRQPGLVRALKTEQHFFVHRYLARLGRARVTRKDVIALDEFLSAHADIAKELRRKPGQMVNSEFLIAHPPLAKFFEAHPALSSVLLQREKTQGAAKGASQKK